MAMMHNSLIAYYEKLFALKQYHGWSVSEIEDLLPWELDVVISFLNNYLEAKDLAMKQAISTQKAL